MDSFFKTIPKTDAEKAALKRKNEEKAADRNKKKKLDAKAKKEAKSKPKGTA